ncbi:MAG: ABC transporter permease, partial [Acidobacteriota bacterium]|nr:ABC transporter permease [Acidobacteriota bacterium]
MNSLGVPGKWEKFLWPVLASALFLAVWHCSVIWTATKVFPSPLAVEKGIAELVRKSLLWSYVGDSLRRVAIGFGAA